MARRLIWTSEKTRGVSYKRATCSYWGWVWEIRPIRGGAYFRPEAFPANKEAVGLEFRNHDCKEFPGGVRRWRLKPT
jgi:hypothetical protein